MNFTPENLKAREKFLTPELIKRLGNYASNSDPLTLTATDDLPRAFNIGSCQNAGAGKAEVRVLLFWKDDARSEQREITIEAVRSDDRWLVNNIFNNSTNLRETLN